MNQRESKHSTGISNSNDHQPEMQHQNSRIQAADHPATQNQNTSNCPWAPGNFQREDQTEQVLDSLSCFNWGCISGSVP